MNSNQLSVTTLAVALSLVVSVIALAQDDNQTVGMVELTGESAQYWPRWRGPSGQGLL